MWYRLYSIKFVIVKEIFEKWVHDSVWNKNSIVVIETSCNRVWKYLQRNVFKKLKLAKICTKIFSECTVWS